MTLVYYEINIKNVLRFVIQNYNSDLRRGGNPLKRWWMSVDKVSIFIIFIISSLSLAVVTTASPAVATRIGVEPLYFMKRHIVYLGVGFVLVVGISMLNISSAKRLAILGFFASLVVLLAVIFIGSEIKGAKRWINFAGLSIQPSEFAKVFFSVFSAWVLSLKYDDPLFPAFRTSAIFYALFAGLLILQPDFGMVMLVSVVWVGQMFIAGMPLIWFVLFGVFGVSVLSASYMFLPHVKKRFDSFLHPENFENYQIKKSLEAFKSGGFYGVGPGEGVVKQSIPDSHADFIFSVIGEEMGFIACMFLILMFAALVIRGLYIAINTPNSFSSLAISGIMMQIGIQSIFNIGMSLHMFPTKGMTLPLVSYGGSSIMSTSIALGMMLVFSRKRYDVLHLPERGYKINVY